MQLMVSPEQDAHKVKSIAPETIECCKQKHLVLGVQAWELILLCVIVIIVNHISHNSAISVDGPIVPIKRCPIPVGSQSIKCSSDPSQDLSHAIGESSSGLPMNLSSFTS